MSQRTIFRDNVLKHYMHGQEKDSLPRFISWPIPVFLWVLLAILLTGCAIAWYEEVPVYASASGMVLNSKGLVSHRQDIAVALVLAPPGLAEQLHAGQPIKIQIGQNGPETMSKISIVMPGIVSPYTIRKRLGLNGKDALIITQPSVVVLVDLENISPGTYAGSVLSARLEIGSRRLLALLPGLGSLVGK
jgi:hypothetical protein